MGNYLCFIPVFTLVLPFFYYWRLPDFSLQKGTGLLILIVASVYSEFLAYEQIFLKDAEYLINQPEIIHTYPPLWLLGFFMLLDNFP